MTKLGVTGARRHAAVEVDTPQVLQEDVAVATGKTGNSSIGEGFVLTGCRWRRFKPGPAGLSVMLDHDVFSDCSGELVALDQLARHTKGFGQPARSRREIDQLRCITAHLANRLKPEKRIANFFAGLHAR